MDLEEEYAEVCRRLAEAEAEAARVWAQVAGLRAEKGQLVEVLGRMGRAPEVDVASPDAMTLSRTDAIVGVLEARQEPMSIGELVAALEASGRIHESYHVVAATVQQLLGSGRVARVGRGLYTARGQAGSRRSGRRSARAGSDAGGGGRHGYLGAGRSTCREEILDAIQAVVRRSGDDTFRVDEVQAEMARRGTRYSPATISTEIRSRMCVGAPQHHAVTYDDVERVRLGVYRLRRVEGGTA